MNTTKLLENFSNYKGFVSSVSKKVALKAKRSGQSFKEYIHDNENVSHISLVVYDILPLPLKFAMRYEKFDKSFVKNFSLIRQKIFKAPIVYAEINPPKFNLDNFRKKTQKEAIEKPETVDKRTTIKKAKIADKKIEPLSIEVQEPIKKVRKPVVKKASVPKKAVKVNK